MTAFRLAVLNLTRRRVSTFIALISIALSVACSGILLRLDLLSENRFSDLAHGGDAIVGAKAGGIEILLGALGGEGPYPGYLPYRLFQSLEAEQTVRFEDGKLSQPSFIRSIVPLLYFAKYEEFRVVGTSDKWLKHVRSELNAGRWPGSLDEVVLGFRVARSFERQGHTIQIGDSIAARSWAGPDASGSVAVPLKIVGFLKESHSAWDRELFTTVETAQRSLASLDLHRSSIWGPQVLNYFLLDLEPDGFTGLQSLVDRRTVGQAVSVGEARARLETLTGTGHKLGWFVMGLILLLSGLSVSAVLITRFESMALQLAVLRALGYTRRTISAWLLWEGCLLGIIACGIGAIFDLLGFPWMRDLLGDALPSADVISSVIWQSAPIWLIAIGATVASVVIPLLRMYRQDVHFSLRD